eukprot:CAMPEP_0117759164 /NCGR_PEP_ID=MMETSP0947-20121206/15849_1 /TAXON_ID=44440 /ORGANISM="Chattonella subsalsa, Strain CCMP2191" /LENGTH=63 /DNA_ID=CAMNT_0005579567 /DNA_START=1783 /DNA_END=1974 /DNA_ORIENTATION=+
MGKGAKLEAPSSSSSSPSLVEEFLGLFGFSAISKISILSFSVFVSSAVEFKGDIRFVEAVSTE